VKASSDEQAERSEKKKPPQDQNRYFHARKSMVRAVKLSQID
jgi:hypothetical protein